MAAAAASPATPGLSLRRTLFFLVVQVFQVRSVQESGPLQADVHEGGLQSRFYRGDDAHEHVADDPSGVSPLDEDFHRVAIFHHGNADLVGRRINDYFFFHGSSRSIRSSDHVTAQPELSADLTHFL
jgi:hypothetical protein